jgi:hypothetical protein
MDFIERIFHVAPDGGTGLLELAIVLALIVLLAVVTVRRQSARSSPSTRALPGPGR